MVGWLRRLCGGWVRNAGNKTQLRPAGAGALPELGKIATCLSYLCKNSVTLLTNEKIAIPYLDR